MELKEEVRKYFDPYGAAILVAVAAAFVYLQLGSNDQDAVPEIRRYGIEIEVSNDGYGRIYDVRIMKVVRCHLNDSKDGDRVIFGIQPGDRITAVNNIPVKNQQDVLAKYRKEKNSKALAPYYAADGDLVIYVERPVYGMTRSWEYPLPLNPDPSKQYLCRKKANSAPNAAAAPKRAAFPFFRRRCIKRPARQGTWSVHTPDGGYDDDQRNSAV